MLLGSGTLFAENSQDQPDPALNIQLIVETLHVRTNGMRGDSESGGDSCLPQVVENELRDLQFPFRKCQAASDLQPLPIGQKRVQTADFRVCGG